MFTRCKKLCCLNSGPYNRDEYEPLVEDAALEGMNFICSQKWLNIDGDITRRATKDRSNKCFYYQSSEIFR